MSFGRLLIGLFLGIHLVLTAATLAEEGIWAPFPPFDRLQTWQIFSDLVCSSVVTVFLIRERNLSDSRLARVWLLLIPAIALLGSVAPMIYLLGAREKPPQE